LSKESGSDSGKVLGKLPNGNSGKELPNQEETRVRRSGKSKCAGQGDFFATQEHQVCMGQILQGI
jgi:hypothetical protein